MLCVVMQFENVFYLFIYFSFVGTSHERHVKELIGHVMCQSDDQRHLQVSLIKFI